MATKLIINLPKICHEINNKNIKTVTIKKEHDDYYLCLTYSTPVISKEPNNNFLSIDPGVTNIATGFSNIGTYFQIKNKTFKSLEKSVSKVQSIMGIKKKGQTNIKK